jgi:hypothetical protein
MTILQAQEIVKRTQYGPSGKKKGQLFLHDVLRDVIPHSELRIPHSGASGCSPAEIMIICTPIEGARERNER